MNARLVVAITLLLTASFAEGMEEKARCFGNYGNGDCTGKDAGECVKLDDGYVLEICPPTASDAKRFPNPISCPSTSTSQGLPGLCSEWSYVLTKSGRKAHRSNQLSISLPAAVRVFKLVEGGKLNELAVGDHSGFGSHDSTTRVLRFQAALGAFSFVTNLVNSEPRAVVLRRSEGDKKPLQAAISGPSSRAVEPLTITDRGFTDRRGRRMLARTDVLGNTISVEAFNPDGKRLPVRKVPLGRTLFCLPPVDRPAADGRISVTEYDCRPLEFLPEGTLIKTGGSDDPCSNLGGYVYCY